MHPSPKRDLGRVRGRGMPLRAHRATHARRAQSKRDGSRRALPCTRCVDCRDARPSTLARMSMTDALAESRSARVLDPIERTSEVLFGLFMVLTFTGTLSVADSGREEVRDMLVAAIGCNIAWGFVDGVMYVLRNLVERARRATLMRAVREAADPAQAHGIISQEIGDVSRVLGEPALERMRRWIVEQPASASPKPRVTVRDLKGAVAVFLLVFLSTFPVVLPFVFIVDAGVAKRASAAVAIAMLFACGFAWGRYSGMKAWRTGLVMVLLGLGVEVIVIALGG
jgi:VIT1/CCC1 family predicted Fe2+/Mn2+ transporter